MEGAGLGLLGGLVIGISEAEWLRLAITLALIAYAGQALKENKSDTAGNSYRLAFAGFASFLAVLAGLYLNGQQVFRQTPRETVALLTEAGYTPEEARKIYLKQTVTGKQRQAVPKQSFDSIISTYFFNAEQDSVSVFSDTLNENTGPLQTGDPDTAASDERPFQ